MEAKARYLDWRNKKDEKSGLSFRFRTNVLRRDPPDPPNHRKAFDEASESLEGLFLCDLSTLSGKSFREDIDKLNRARPSFKDYFFQDSGVRRITTTVPDHFGGIDQIFSHSLYIIKMLWRKSAVLLPHSPRSNSVYSYLDRDVYVDQCVLGLLPLC